MASDAEDVPDARGSGSDRRSGGPRRAAELTGELPAVVREAIEDARTGEIDAAGQETVEALIDLGVDEDEARDAVRQGRVPLVLTQQVLGERPRYTIEELVGKSGVPADVLRDARVAAGMPVPERFTRTDLELAKLLARLLEILPVDAVLRTARSRGAALAAIARSDLSVVRDELVLPMRQAGADDLTVSVALAETARALDELSSEMMLHTYNLQVRHQLSSELSAIAARSEGHEVDIAVGFVDVVGYTALSARVDPEGLDAVLDNFERRVVETVGADRDVGIVKYLGDAVMLVGPDPVTLAGAMLELTVEVDELADAPLRGGLASGETLVREGDYFGQPVNMAARLTDLARPWSLLADEALVDVLSGAFDVKRIMPTRVRGVGLRRPLVVRPVPEPDEDERAKR